MGAIQVFFLDGRSARRQPATLDYVDGSWRLSGAFGERHGAPAEVVVSEPMGGAPRQINWPDGAYCEITDAAGLARLLERAGHRPSSVQVLQGRWRWAVASLAGVAGLLALGYFSLLPWVAAQVAPRIPARVNASLSAQVLATIDAHVVGPSALPESRRKGIAERLARVADRVPGLPAYRLHFRSGGRIGPNAFALPGGDIVLLDPLVEMAASDDEVVAVLLHELGHVVDHHGMRQMIQTTVVSVVVGLWFGDISSAAASLGAVVLESRYSREFELEADRFGARVLSAAGLSPLLLAAMLEKLEAAHAARNGKPPDGDAKASGTSGADLLDTHPETAARIEMLRSLARPR